MTQKVVKNKEGKYIIEYLPEVKELIALINDPEWECFGVLKHEKDACLESKMRLLGLDKPTEFLQIAFRQQSTINYSPNKWKCKSCIIIGDSIYKIVNNL